MTRALPLLTILLAGACSRGPSDAELAAQGSRLAATADPAVTLALEDPLMTDRDLQVADHSRRVRLVTGPAQALYPPETPINARLTAALRPLKPGNGCESGFVKGLEWAARLPAAFGIYPGAALVEAAGNDVGTCRSRFVAFRPAAAPQAVVDWHRARALAGGYTAEFQQRGSDRVLGGTRARDGASYYFIVSPRAGGSEAALLTVGG